MLVLIVKDKGRLAPRLPNIFAALIAVLVRHDHLFNNFVISNSALTRSLFRL